MSAWPPLTQKALEQSNRTPTASFVYFILDVDQRRVKIGKAANPRKRLANLQVGASSRLALIGVLAGGKELERELHDLFAESRVRGEWFSATPEIHRLIEEAQAAGTRDDSWAEPASAAWTEPAVAVVDELAEILGLDRRGAREYVTRLLRESVAA